MGCIRLTALFALTIAVSTLLGTESREARATICEELKPVKGCVVSLDIRRKKIKSDDRKDEARAKGVSLADIAMEVGFGRKLYAATKIKLPRAGVVIVNASLYIAALEDPDSLATGKGTVVCQIRLSNKSDVTIGLSQEMYGSVDWKAGIEFDSMALTSGFDVARKGPIKIDLSCLATTTVPFGGNFAFVRIHAPSISAAYYSASY